MSTNLEELRQSIIRGDMPSAVELTRKSLAEQVLPEVLLNQGLIPAMTMVGKLFEDGEFFIPEMLIAARAMQASLDILRPQLEKTDVKPLAVVVVGTVMGDLHDIGKNLVRMMLQGGGFQVIDLGTDVAPEKFIQAIREHGAKLVGISALLTTTMTNMRTTIEAIRQAGPQVRIMVGGAPVTESYAQSIKADGYAPDASRAVAVAKSLLGI